MEKLKIFDGINENDLKKMLICFNATTLNYDRNSTILSNIGNSARVGVILSGKAQILRYNYNGSRTIIDTINEGQIFGSFTSPNVSDLYIVSTEPTKILMFDYDHIINRCKKNCPYHNKVVDNMLKIMADKVSIYSDRIEVLTEKTIRDKLLAYFNSISKKQITKNVTLPLSLTDTADYLSIDRSAMMREMKNLKEEGLIEYKGRHIKINY